MVWRRRKFIAATWPHDGEVAARSMSSAVLVGTGVGQGLLTLPPPPPPRYSTLVSSMTAEP